MSAPGEVCWASGRARPVCSHKRTVRQVVLTRGCMPFAAQRLLASRSIGGRALHSPASDGARERAPENACLRRLPFGQQRSRTAIGALK